MSLYVVPTPIGNLGDITIRSIETLKAVDIIACEDTRHTLKLLNHFEIHKPLLSYHQHNESIRSQQIISKLLEGKSIALVSDAGMPGISDPGEVLIKEAIDNGIEVIVLPGANAAIVALVGSGIDTSSFTFVGFLPSKAKQRDNALIELAKEQRTLILYEAPHRLLSTLEAIFEHLGDRNIAVGRELTKRFEEITRGSVSEVIEAYKSRAIKGEVAIVIEKAEAFEAEYDISSELRQELKSGLSLKDAVKQVVKRTGRPKNEVYALAIDIYKE